MSEIRQAQNAITEGFICANCKQQLGSVEDLLKHYDLCQRKSRFGGGTGDFSENGGGGGIKGFIGKAKQKLRFDSPPPSLSPVSSSQALYQQGGGAGGSGSGAQDKGSPPPTYFMDFDSAPNSEGVWRSSFNEFKRIRGGRLERYASESNKLKIRLSKLVSGLEKFPSLMTKTTAGFQDSAEWKAHEKSIVNWLDEKPVTRCPECAGAFSLLKRKHHCRLCGSILCNECSDFIPLSEAFQILHSELKVRHDAACASITFRTCGHCLRFLRQESLFSPKSNSGESSDGKLLLLYNTIKDKMGEIENLMPQLVTVVESIKSGETLYSREEANLLRSKLLRSSEQIDVLSKQISALKSESSSEVMLQQRIRQSCISFIREFIRTVPIVPDMADDATSSTSGSSGVIGEGWSACAPDNQGHDYDTSRNRLEDLDDNPIQQQIKNVKFYIEQAQAAGRVDEVEMLASSLRDLLLWQKGQENF